MFEAYAALRRRGESLPTYSPNAQAQLSDQVTRVEGPWRWAPPKLRILPLQPPSGSGAGQVHYAVSVSRCNVACPSDNSASKDPLSVAPPTGNGGEVHYKQTDSASGEGTVACPPDSTDGATRATPPPPTPPPHEEESHVPACIRRHQAVAVAPVLPPPALARPR